MGRLVRSVGREESLDSPSSARRIVAKIEPKRRMENGEVEGGGIDRLAVGCTPHQLRPCPRAFTPFLGHPEGSPGKTQNLAVSSERREGRRMLYIAVGLAVALVAKDLYDMTSRGTETRRRIGER